MDAQKRTRTKIRNGSGCLLSKHRCYNCRYKGLGIKGCKHPKIREQKQFKTNPCPFWEKGD